MKVLIRTMRRLSSMMVVVVSLCMGISPALAGGAGKDEVQLKNGGMVRGELVSIAPEKEVVIIVEGTKEVVRIP